MKLSRTVNVAILEHTDHGFTRARKFIQNVLVEVNYDVNFIELGRDHFSPGSHKNIFNKKIIDIFISDISLGDTSSLIGLDYIRQIKELYPDILVIGMSQHSISIKDISNRLPSADLFLYKPNLLNDDYMKKMGGKVAEYFKKNVSVAIDEERSNLVGKFRRQKHKVELNRILRSITFTSHTTDESTLVSRVELVPIESGYSGSQVYKMSAYSSTGLLCVYAVLKLSEPEKAKEEIENYKNYVNWYLPYTWRPEIIAKAFTKNWGAICYSFVYNDSKPFYSLNHFIENKNSTIVQKVIDQIFSTKYKRWYHVKNVRQVTNKDISKYYHERVYNPNFDSDSIVREIVKDYKLHKNGVVVIEGDSYPFTEGFLFGRGWGNFQTCITHGDMHGGNILVTEDADQAFIDFQDTGFGHVFEDFVVLESSIRLQYNSEAEIKDLVRWEFSELNDEESSIQYGKLIRKIRNLAFSNFPDEPFNNYIYSLAAFSIHLLKLKHLQNWQKTQLCACLLASMRKLKDG